MSASVKRQTFLFLAGFQCSQYNSDSTLLSFRSLSRMCVFPYFYQYYDEQQELHKYTVLKCMESVLRKASNYGLKALILHHETLAFKR